MIEEKKKNKVIKGIALLGLFLMVFGISYALFRVTLNGNKTNRIKTGKMELLLLNENGETIEEDTIGIDNALPISDEEGKELIPYSFTLKNNGTISTEYSITLNDLELDEGETRLDDKYVTMYLVRGENLVEEIGPLSLATVKDRVIDAGIIKPGFETSYKLYTWVDISADTGASGKVFKTQLKVDGTQINDTTLSRTIIYRDDATNKNSIIGYNRETDGLTASQTLYADGTFDIYGSGNVNSSISITNTSLKNAYEYYFLINLLKREGEDTSSLDTLKAVRKAVENYDGENLIDKYYEEVWNEYNLNKDLGEETEYDFGGYASDIKESNPGLYKKLRYELVFPEANIVNYISKMNIKVNIDNRIEGLRFTGNSKNTDIVLPNNLKRIYAISDCILDELIIPESVTSIETDRAHYDATTAPFTPFAYTTIDELTIPASVTRVSGAAFVSSNINKINILGSTEGWSIKWNEGFNGIIN